MKIEIDDEKLKEVVLEQIAKELVYMFVNGRDLNIDSYEDRQKAIKKRFEKIFNGVTHDKLSNEFLKQLSSKAFEGLLK